MPLPPQPPTSAVAANYCHNKTHQITFGPPEAEGQMFSELKPSFNSSPGTTRHFWYSRKLSKPLFELL